MWWGIGGNLIIYVATLSGIDKSVLEAANLDDAKGFKWFWNQQELMEPMNGGFSLE